MNPTNLRRHETVHETAVHALVAARYMALATVAKPDGPVASIWHAPSGQSVGPTPTDTASSGTAHPQEARATSQGHWSQAPERRPGAAALRTASKLRPCRQALQ